MDVNSILLIEPDLNLQQAITEILIPSGYTVVVCKDVAAAISLAATEKFSLSILSTYADINNMVDNIFKLQQQPGLPVLMLTDYASIDKAELAIQAGAVDYLVKPFTPDSLLNLTRRHVIAAVVDGLTPVAESKGMRMMLNLACKVAKSSVKVLISGEPGTGKKTIAKYVHAASMVSAGSFTTINCAISNPTILESVLFGYESKNAAGEHEEFPGKLELAKDGTVLLDEIAELPLDLQARLLAIFRDRVIRVVDREKVVPLKARIIATTSKDLQQEVKEHRFNEDLYFMLSIFPIKLLPLKERKEDILPLANMFLQKYAIETGKAFKFSEEASQYLVKRKWQNNINELELVLDMALRIAKNGIIMPQDLTAVEFDELSIVAKKPALKDEINQLLMPRKFI